MYKKKIGSNQTALDVNDSKKKTLKGNASSVLLPLLR
jgi:hypothetical protein